jgi:hypothetical protein
VVSGGDAVTGWLMNVLASGSGFHTPHATSYGQLSPSTPQQDVSCKTEALAGAKMQAWGHPTRLHELLTSQGLPSSAGEGEEHALLVSELVI